MRIDKLELTNFRCFEHAEIEFAKRFTLLIGDNGSGKTAVLDGLAAAVGAFLLDVPGADTRPPRKSDQHIDAYSIGQSVQKHETGDTKVRAIGAIPAASTKRGAKWTPLDWFRELKVGRTKPTEAGASAMKEAAGALVSLATKSLRSGEIPPTLPVVSYYGTGRLWSSVRAAPSAGPIPRLVGYQESLNPASDHKRLFRWFRLNEMASLQKKQVRHVLEAVRSTIVDMVPGAVKAVWDMDWDELCLEYEAASTEDGRPARRSRLPFRLLSDGYRNLVGIAADVAYRAATLNPHLLKKAVASTPGIVLIDEIDLHLHPNWQRTVVDSLMKTFPKIQFVATTHSPFIIQSLYNRPDTKLWDLVKSEEVAIPSKSIEDIAEDNQGVELPQQSRRFLEKEAAAIEFFEILKQGAKADPDERARAKLRLDELMRPYSDDPAFQARLTMQRIASGIDGETTG